MDDSMKKSFNNEDLTINTGAFNKIVFTSEENINSKFVICEVCGYTNPVTSALCKNCSNYLFL